MLAIRGAESRIAIELRKRVNNVLIVGRGQDVPLDCDRYLFANGLLSGLRADQATKGEAAEQYWANAGYIIQQCRRLIRRNPQARICIVGSESGFAWSYDDHYAASKAALHQFVCSAKLLSDGQQLVAVAPGIIADAGMTTRRDDQDRVATRALAHPKGRHLQSSEVASLIHYLLYVDGGYITNQVIRMNGGEHL